MTVHAIQGYLAPDSGMTDSDIQTAIDDWVSARTKWGQEDWDATVSRSNTAIDGSGTEYVQFRVRFTWDSDTKDNTLQKCADKFKNKLAWFSLIYHTCYHDETGGCSWEEEWQWDDGNGIPQAILDETPDTGTVVNA